MKFYLVRHGRSRANEAGLVTGTCEDVLSEIGRAQAARMAAWLHGAGIVADRYVVSQWQRARQTAACLGEQPWQIDARLGETNAGDVADWTLTRFLETSPAFYADPANRYPGGESHDELNARVLAWFHAQLADPVDAVMAVAHSGPISCLIQHVTGVEMARFPAFLPHHCSLSVIEMTRSGDLWKPRLTGFSLGPAENWPEGFVTARKEGA